MGNARALPLFVYFLLLVGTAMLAPGTMGYLHGNQAVASSFLFSSLLIVVTAGCIALATLNRQSRLSVRSHLSTILVSLLILPAVCALPMREITPTLRFDQAYFEMLSCLTTTGSTLFTDPGAVPDELHLWRGLVGWMGGFLTILWAIAILEPLNLGGFEVGTGGGRAQVQIPTKGTTRHAFLVLKHVRTIAPVYVSITFALALLLLMAGESGLVAAMHAMAIISTSGISPLNGLETTNSGMLGEVVIVFFFAFALSHRAFTSENRRENTGVGRDAEMRFGLILVSVLALVLVVRQVLGALEVDTDVTFMTIVTAMWGSFFTLLSFLTTTGFVSTAIEQNSAISGLDEPELMLLSLAFFGGGIATTAGGIKLLRVVALMSHGRRELSRLVYPSSVAGAGSDGRRVRREGAYVAWMFVMLFFLSIGCGALALSLAGLEFEGAFVVTMASIANVGPLMDVFDREFVNLRGLESEPLLVLDALMIIGRMEILAAIALFNPEYWRR